MYKVMFQNSKVALVFAGITLFSAVSMVGTWEDKGALPQAVDRFGAERSAIASDAQAFVEERSQGDAPPPKPVFGQFDESAVPETAANPQHDGNPMDAPLSATAVVAAGSGSAVRGEPYISDREMTIAPE